MINQVIFITSVLIIFCSFYKLQKNFYCANEYIYKSISDITLLTHQQNNKRIINKSCNIFINTHKKKSKYITSTMSGERRLEIVLGPLY